MPNHVANELVIKGESSALKDFIRFAKGTGIHWKGSSKPTVANDLELSHFVHPEKGNRGRELPIPFSAMGTGERMGYDWCIDNWGTKWGAYRVVLKDESEHGEGEISYQFNTAWEPFSNQVSIAMASVFPTLRFELTYFEPLMGFKGERVWNHTDGLVMKFHDEYREDEDCPFQYECSITAG